MSEKSSYLDQTLRLKNMVRDLSKSPDLEDLPIAFYREEIRYKALAATSTESSPERISEYFFGENINPYEQKSYSEHLKDMGPRPQAILATLLALSTVLGIAVGMKTENEFVGTGAGLALASTTLLLFDKLIHLRLEAMPVSQRTKEFYQNLKKVYVLCQRLQHVRNDGTYESHARARSLYQEAQELIIQMQREFEEYEQRHSGTFLKKGL